MVQQQILETNGWQGRKAWAFGLGLERLAMVKFAIGDIRLFWTSDQRFLKQFRAGDLSTKFKSYSKYPPCFKVRIVFSFGRSSVSGGILARAGDTIYEVVFDLWNKNEQRLCWS